MLGGEAFAVAREVADEPDAGLFPVAGRLANERGQERVRGLSAVIEHEFAVTGGERSQACGEIRVGDGAAEPAVGGGVRVGHGGWDSAELGNLKFEISNLRPDAGGGAVFFTIGLRGRGGAGRVPRTEAHYGQPLFQYRSHCL